MAKTLQNSAKEAHNRREKILKLKRVGSFAWLKLGKELYLVEKNEDWDKLGFDSMRQYMAAPEASGGLDLTRTWILQFKLNYEKFVKELGHPGDQIAQLEPSKLRCIYDVVNKDNVDEWLEKAKNLSRSDLIEEVKEIKGVGEKWKRYFDVWNFSKIDPNYGVIGYPGQIPYEIVANTLYYFSDENDLIVDPMAGGGTTIDVCEKLIKRKYLAYDIKPVRREIKKWNFKDGLSEEMKKVGLIFWDPPYWKKKADEYSDGSISELSRKEYLDFFKKTIKEFADCLKKNGKIAFLMSNYIDYDNPKETILTADYYNYFIQAGLVPLYEIQCPLSSEQYAGFQVNQAKEKKKLLIISRSLYIYGKV